MDAGEAESVASRMKEERIRVVVRAYVYVFSVNLCGILINLPPWSGGSNIKG